MKIILLFIVFIFAAVIAMALLGRLMKTQSQLADLNKKLSDNDEELAKHRKELERIAVNQEINQEPKDKRPN